MENEDTVKIEVNKTDLKHQFGKLILATAAGFIAQKVAENAYDKFAHRNQNTTADTQQ